jgi:hypothetical protein
MPELIVALVTLVGTAMIAAAIFFSVRGLRREREVQSRESLQLSILQVFAPAAIEASGNPKRLLVWQPMALAARRRFPEAFADLDRAYGKTFPFGAADVQEAHAQWTADWLAWEVAHDAEYKLKAAHLAEQLEHLTGERAALVRAQLAGVEREQLERYQQRYVEYVRVGKALAALTADAAPGPPDSQGTAGPPR